MTTAETSPVFIATGTPRASFGRAYIPDNGQNIDIFQRDLGYLGIGFDTYVSLSNGNITQMLRDDDMVAVLPASFLANPNLAFMFDEPYFAFRPTPDGLAAVRLTGPGGTIMAPRDLAPMRPDALPIVELSASQTTLIADTDLPADGALSLGLFAMRADPGQLAQVLRLTGLDAGPTALVDGPQITGQADAPGSAVMFMAVSQGDSNLAPLMARRDMRFYAATNFGLAPVWPAAAGPQRNVSPPMPAPDQPQAPLPRADDFSPPAPDLAATQATKAPLPPAAPFEIDFARTEQLLIVVPSDLRPEDVRNVHLVWRLVRSRADGVTISLPYFSLADSVRVDALRGTVLDAMPGVTVETASVFGDLRIEGNQIDPQVIRNLASTGAALAIPSHLAASMHMSSAIAAFDGTFWMVRDDGLDRVDPPNSVYTAGPVVFDALDDPAVVLVHPAGEIPPHGMNVKIAALAHIERSGTFVSGPPEKLLDPLGLYSQIRPLHVTHNLLGLDSEIDLTGQLVFDLDRGVLTEAAVYVLTAADLRRPELAPLRTADLVAFTLLTAGQAVPIAMQGAQPSEPSEALLAHRAARADIIAQAGGVLALARNGLEMTSVVTPIREAQNGEIVGSGIGLVLVDGSWTVRGGTRGGQIPLRSFWLRVNRHNSNPEGRESRAKRVFLEPRTGVLLSLPEDGKRPISERDFTGYDQPRFDPLFDGSRRFVTIEGNQPVEMPRLPPG
ncbi:hypothetical protein [Paracoccus salsus]|uniref:hypothetical protein n=1 Tax=Paracoccus salsus TaxID=2911061 RepID=UPI001F43819C|nr:hypothetical protein [Paracoccus salsus]MCF3974820.1 hypothetical protein [Paracoccus salsus]